MKFAQPFWLIFGAIACAALVWRNRRFDARQHSEFAKFASTTLLAQLTVSVSHGRRRFKRALVLAGVACIAIALARPLAGFRWEEAKRHGLDLLIAVDTSRSMLAQDVKPDRLTRAKMAVEDLLAKMDGDRVGLIAFAGNSFLQCPLTLDYDAFRQSLAALDTQIIPRGGTDIAAAIREAGAALEASGNNERILVLITDGEDLEGSALDAARAAAGNGLKIFTVGVGSAGGELIPVADEQGGSRFEKDSSGQFVKSRLDEAMLKQIAEISGAMYQPLGQQAEGLETIYQKGLAKFTRRELASRMQKVYLERFQWPLALGLFCLVAETLIGIRRRQAIRKSAAAVHPQRLVARSNRGAARGLQSASANEMWGSQESSNPLQQGAVKRPEVRALKLAATAAVCVVFATAHSTLASPTSAEKAYQKGEFKKAEQDYATAAAKNPAKPEIQFNHGAAAYKSGDFDTAAKSFARAMNTQDLGLQEDNYYNLGNTQYRLGQKTEQSDAPQTIKTWEEAVKSYAAALELKKDDADAKYNSDLVKRRLEALKQKQKQEQQDQKNQQQQQDQNRNQDPQKDQQNESKNQPQQQNNPGSGKDQDKQDKQKKESDKQNSGSGEAKKPDQTDNRNQGKNNEQPKDSPSPGAGEKPEEPKDPQDKRASGSDAGETQSAKADPQNPVQEPAKSGPKQDSQPRVRNPQPKDKGDEQADAQREPGKMSRGEAKQLLDSLKDGDRKMPLAPAARGKETGPREDPPLKDW